MMIDLLFSYFLSVGRERLLIEGNEIKFPNQWWKLEKSSYISPESFDWILFKQFLWVASFSSLTSLLP